jgi:hypothetical protein
MKIYDLNNIKKVTQRYDKELGQTDFYDLTESTFRSRVDVSYNYYYVQKNEEMRIDLVCYSIYNNTDYIDILLNVNEIDNPLNIKYGDVIKYPSDKDIPLFRVKTESKDITNTLINKNKSTRKDKNRNKYIEENFTLPPTVLQNTIEPVIQEGDNIVIGAGLFNS